MTRGEGGNLLILFTDSKLVKCYTSFLHVLVLVAVIATNLALFIKLSLLIGVICHYGFILYKSKSSIIGIKYSEEIGWEILIGNDYMPIDVLKSTVITTQMLFLHFKIRPSYLFLNRWRKSTFLVVSDMLSEQDYRYLVVKLRMTVIK
jgi:hypothetical protein